MTYKIRKGNNSVGLLNRIFHFKLFYNKSPLKYKAIFTDSCRYNLKDIDQLDINKLFGIGYFSWNLSPHHIDSARFGWRWNEQKQKIEIFVYCYINGERVIDPLYECDLNKQYTFTLIINKHNKLYNFNVRETLRPNYYDSVLIPFNHNKKLGFFLEPYFGGNKTAPHKIIINLQKM